MALSWISIARLVTLSLGLLFGFVSIAIGGHMLSLTALTYDFEGLAVACGVFNLITLPVFLVMGILRKGTFLTMNVVEIPVLGFLTVLWLAESILLTQAGSFFFASTACGNVRFAIDRTFCQEISALQGLSFVLWIFFFGYVVTTITFCIIGKSRGNDVWLVSATEAKYFEVNATAPQNEGTMMMAPGVQPQYTGVPQQVPQQQYQAAQQYPSPAPSQGNPVYAQPQQQYSPAPTSQHTGYAGQAQV
ncbi:hypothetical protein Moror_7943 [Moniliophthora roreri MCA 2997]|uniref:MARVEL domain-containing protein n=2 Tax=Moniliophthora roreri TaxID=221103 RepID=V2XB04_MONRO|nr:hypothetical protein Moror_7943 [Moniliophthora roreri MCA 2997]KAI3604365.1 hypothetical protein WG66_008295 [Moniliophthora roreri]